MARRVGAHAYREHQPLTAAYYSYWSGISDLGASFHARTGRLILVWPTNEDLTCIYVVWPHQEFRRVRHDVERSFHSALELVPGLRDTVASGRREERFAGTGDLPNLYRTSAGPGWALADDAGHHKDPATGMGMSDAFLATELLAEAIHDGLAGHRPMEQAVATYQQRRNALTASGFELTLATGGDPGVVHRRPHPRRSGAAPRPASRRRRRGRLTGRAAVGRVYLSPPSGPAGSTRAPAVPSCQTGSRAT